MKAKNISGRLARFLAVLMAMVLIVSCMAIPVALAEEDTNAAVTQFSFCICGLESNLYKQVRSELRETFGDFVGEFSKHPTSDKNSLPDDQRLAYIVVEEGSEDLFSNTFLPNVAFFLDVGAPVLVGESLERNSEYWAVYIAFMLNDNTDVYLYTSNSETDCAKVAKLTVEVLTSTLLEENEYNIILEEVGEGSYMVKGTAESETPSGVLHIISLDMSPEEAWEQVYSDLQNYLLIATGQAPEVSEDDTTEVTANE